MVMRPGIVAPALAAQPLGQRLDRLALPQLAAVDDDELPSRRGRRVEGLECHCCPSPPQIPVVTSIRWPSARVTIAFLTSERRPGRPRNRLTLPTTRIVLTAVTLTLNSPSTAALTSRLVAVERHAKDHLVVLRGVGRLFGDHRGADDVVHLLARQLRLGGRDDAKSAHLRRASRCCTASRVKTSVSRRRMS